VTTLRALLGVRAHALAADATVDAGTPFDRERFETVFAATGRRLGSAPVGREAALRDDGGRTWSIAGWGVDELGRAFLLREAAARIPIATHPDWIADCYRTGALRERTALLRVLPLLPEPARFLPIALDACRTSTQPIFEAVACENPYPAAYFPADAFDQLGMKAVFTGVALARILGLVSRRTPELARMARDYADERRAAGRDVPADLTLLTDP